MNTFTKISALLLLACNLFAVSAQANSAFPQAERYFAQRFGCEVVTATGPFQKMYLSRNEEDLAANPNHARSMDLVRCKSNAHIVIMARSQHEFVALYTDDNNVKAESVQLNSMGKSAHLAQME